MKRHGLTDLIKKISYSVAVNIISLIINVVIVLVLPKCLGPKSYGYYQLYTFYIGYVGIAYFGWCEGIYLRTGGKVYSDLDKELYSSQFCLLLLLEVLIFSTIAVVSGTMIDDTSKRGVLLFTCATAVAMCLRYFITTLLMATYRVKEYSIITIAEKIIFIILVMILLCCGVRQFQPIIFSSVISVFISLSIGICYCSDIVFSRPNINGQVFSEIRENMSSGIRMMISTVSSALIIGAVRFGTENHWDIETFGKVSLTLSVSSMVVTAINAIGNVIYPILRRTNITKLSDIYKFMRTTLMTVILFALTFYYPVQRILSKWLPQYTESMRYAALLFPVCVYESKMSLLINTYYNTLRLENLLMKCNLLSFFVSVLVTLITVYVLDSVTIAILSILMVLVFRCVLCEVVLSTKLVIKVTRDIVLELIMTISFIICNWYFGFAGMLAYAACYLAYLFVESKEIHTSLNFIRSAQ